jgi:hypothetical protein
MFSARKSPGHALGERRFNAPSRRTLPIFGTECFSGAWRPAMGTVPSCLAHFLSSHGLHPHPKSTLGSVCEGFIRVENGLVPASHKPKNRPENKGIKPFTNRHKPKSDRRKVMQAKRPKVSRRPSSGYCLPYPFGGRDAVTILDAIRTTQHAPITSFDRRSATLFQPTPSHANLRKTPTPPSILF